MRFDEETTILIGISPVDFRAGINKLAAVAQAIFEDDPRCGTVFVFRNRRCTDIKLIHYDGTGYFLGHKRLSKGKLQWWPRTERECRSINAEELKKLLHGFDPRGSFHPDWHQENGCGQERRTGRADSIGAYAAQGAPP